MFKWFDFALSADLSGTENLYINKTDSGLSFDTYFNCIPIAKVIKYTNIERLAFVISAVGSHRAEIAVYNGSEKKILAKVEGDTISVEISAVPPDSRLLYLIINGCAKVNGVSVYAECKAVRKISAAAVMCTYKREEYAVSNANLLAEISQSNPLLSQVILVDNGRTVSDSSLNSKIRLVPNINNGGSGGFSKGMSEAVKNKDCTHIILLDDDVSIEPLSLHKMLGFLQFVKEEYWDISVSGSMLYIDNCLRQFEAGGNFGKDGKQKGFGHYLDLSLRESLFENEAENDINYGGWWFMCMPSDYARSGQLPMPFFIKYDDVEYALRCKLRIITLNGVGIWHEPFEWKYNSVSEYYNTRNYLHLCALYCDNFSKKKAKKIAKNFMNEKLYRQQNKMAKAVRLGYKDYRKGLDYLSKINAEEKHKEISKLNYEMLSIDELNQKYNLELTEEKIENGLKDSLKSEYRSDHNFFCHSLFIPAILKSKKIYFTDHFFDTKEMYLKSRFVVHYCRATKKAYITIDGKEMSWKKY
ncbi:MAG: glycosyltransferase family 2 protein [Ruminiclostridium sp.]